MLLIHVDDWVIHFAFIGYIQYRIMQSTSMNMRTEQY